MRSFFLPFRLFASVTLGAVLCTTALAQDSIDSQLVAANQLVQSATMRYDAQTLAKLTTDDYMLVNGAGTVWNKAAFLADVADKSAKWEANDPESVTVRHYNDDCAIVVAILHMRYRQNGKLHDLRARYTDVWVKVNGQWRYASGQATALK